MQMDYDYLFELRNRNRSTIQNTSPPEVAAVKFVHVKTGYCRECHMNVRHVAEYRFKWLAALRWWITKQWLKNRWGRWRCTVCGNECRRIARIKDDADHWEFEEGRKPRRRETRPEVDPAAQPIGNFLLQERSMAAKQERTFPFTEKFRESVIHRLLNGYATIKEVRDELHLSEADLLAWFDDCLQQKQRKIDQLTQLLISVRNAAVDKLPESNNEAPTTNNSAAGGATAPRQRPVFDGEVLPPTPNR
jgi:hypothetical protein